jgi:aminoglycoside/choline kinase family phosphotransferase
MGAGRAVSQSSREAAIQSWLAGLDGYAGVPLEPASSDASFRRYFRLRAPKGSVILMDAPPDKEDCRPFIHVAGLLNRAGVHAPRILAQDLAQGFLLLSDLGDRTYLDVITAANAEALFGDAIGALLRWQQASRPGELPPYDDALLRREVNLFPDWYLARYLELPLSDAERRDLQEMFDLIIRRALAQPKVYVHRDYMPRNLMISEPNPGVLDFQDAVFGPVTYDVVSLFRDAFLSWDEARVRDWARQYWEQARGAGLPVGARFEDFCTDFDWMGLQRHLKVLGIFARIRYRDGKPRYLTDTPRFLKYVRAVVDRYPELDKLRRLWDRIEPAAAARGFPQ